MSGRNDESENQAEHPSERIGTNGWRVMSSPARRPESAVRYTTQSVMANRAETVKFVGVEGRGVVYEVGPGRYQFRVGKFGF